MILYAIILIIGLAVRLLNLGAMPLSELEASWALTTGGENQGAGAFSPAATQVLIGGPQPGYLMLTYASFALITDSNFLARFWPALAGSLLVAFPFFFRRRLGQPAALILAFFLALDPGLVAVSRQAGGPIIALAFTMLAFGLWQDRKPFWAALCAGLALLGGPSLLTGAFGLLLAWCASWLLEKYTLARPLQVWRDNQPSPQALDPQSTPRADDPLEQGKAGREAVRHVSTSFTLLLVGITVLGVGTLLLSVPQGLAAWAGTLPAYLSGWMTSSGTPAGRLLAALLVYQPMALIFAFVGIIQISGRYVSSSLKRQSAEAVDISAVEENSQLPSVRHLLVFPMLWAASALLVALLYPGRQVYDLLWVVVPLWTMATLVIGRYLPVLNAPGIWVQGVRGDLVAFLQAILVFLLLVLSGYTLAASTNLLAAGAISQNASPIDFRWIAIVGILALIGLTTGLVSVGWSWEVGRLGLVWGSLAALLLYQIAALTGAAQLRPRPTAEMWNPGGCSFSAAAPGQYDLILKTLGDLSEWKTGDRRSVDVLAKDLPSLRWMLRDFPQAGFVNSLPPDSQPSIILMPENEQSPSLAAAYRGQDFAYGCSFSSSTQPGGDSAFPPDLLHWLLYRDSPLPSERIILWARSDLFPAGTEPVEKSLTEPAASPVIEPIEVK
jgi:hypothetical protein